LLVPADSKFQASVADKPLGLTRLHALLLHVFGVQQLIIGINKMDSEEVGYKQDRFLEIREEIDRILLRTGWPKKYIDESIPKIPISGWKGDNLITPSDAMDWWKGTEMKLDSQILHIHTLYDALDKLVTIPIRLKDVPLRVPINGIYKIQDLGDVLTGKIEQGLLKAGDEVCFIPTLCTGTVGVVEMGHRPLEVGIAGDICGFGVKGLEKANMPKVGDVMILKNDTTLKRVKTFTAEVRLLDHPGELRVGYCPVAFVRAGRSAIKLTKIHWKCEKENDPKIENPTGLKSKEIGECTFQPQQPLALDLFSNCESLGRVAILEGSNLIMTAKVTGLEFHPEKS
jgi:elongation factor 1-alpha